MAIQPEQENGTQPEFTPDLPTDQPIREMLSLSSAMPASVAVVPDAPNVKLPFIHSKFKPRAKFAKTFNHGFSRLARLNKVMEAEETTGSTKLPRITYNAGDNRSLVSFGAGKRGIRREYPGFAGYNTKSPRRRSNNYSVNSIKPTISTSRSVTSIDTMSDTDSVVWLRYSNKNGIRESIESAHQPFSPSDSTSRLIVKSRRNGNNEDVEHSKKESLPDLNSLIIVEDDESGQTRPNSMAELINSPTQSPRHKKVTFGLEDSCTNDDDILESDPFARGVDTKLKDSGGHSGMKRDRGSRSKRNDLHPRPLGDIITSERLNELLSVKNKGFPLKFS